MFVGRLCIRIRPELKANTEVQFVSYEFPFNRRFDIPNGADVNMIMHAIAMLTAGSA